MKTFKLSSVFLLLTIFAASVFAQKLTSEEIVAKHLDSIGKAEVRASVRNQMAVGEVLITFITQKNQMVQGRIVLVSEGVKNFMGMNLSAADYSFEKFSYDGKDAKVAYVRTNARSDLGNFVLSNDVLLEDSLLAGTLNTSWSLANLATNKAKISSEGTKKIDGKEMYVLGYSPKGGSDINIKIYFDKENFRHVRTEYARTSSASIGRTVDESARQSETRLKVTETFGDFKTQTGLTLPHSYTINYSVTGQRGTGEIEWKFNIMQVAFNQNLDAKTFDADAK